MIEAGRWRSLGAIVTGYLAACLAADFIACLAVVASFDPDASYLRGPNLIAVGFIIITLLAMPGFALSMVVSRILHWRSAIWFVLAGGANSMAALCIFYDGFVLPLNGFARDCMVAGCVGGLVFWLVSNFVRQARWGAAA